MITPKIRPDLYAEIDAFRSNNAADIMELVPPHQVCRITGRSERSYCGKEERLFEEIESREETWFNRARG